MKEKELGVYIHIPFCKQKCYYCDFISYANKTALIEEYIKAIKIEINQNKDKLKNANITTIYIGGGTPSYIESKYIKEILNEIKNNSNTINNAEIAIEANPGTITEQKLQDYKNEGINRLSIGLQSCSNRLLKEIGRIHTSQEFFETFEMARRCGFKNINVDLMLGLPNQTIQDLKESLQKIISLNPEHISVYSLILEEGTKLFDLVESGKLQMPTDEFEREMYWYTKNTLELSDYEHYEISNFAKAGYKSKHNTNCWKQKEYIGFGASAHSYYEKVRYSNVESIEEYIANIQNGKSEENKIIQEVQSVQEEKKEYMLLGLRKIDGVDIGDFKNKFAENPLYVFKNELFKLVEEGLIEVDRNQIKLTSKGLDLANQVWQEFV